MVCGKNDSQSCLLAWKLLVLNLSDDSEQEAAVPTYSTSSNSGRQLQYQLTVQYGTVNKFDLENLLRAFSSPPRRKGVPLLLHCNPTQLPTTTTRVVGGCTCGGGGGGNPLAPFPKDGCCPGWLCACRMGVSADYMCTRPPAQIHHTSLTS